jgi:N-acetylglucosaminyldiphosphoundecaprenol N-acetyl-beta-D-mannosaminyltransferase
MIEVAPAKDGAAPREDDRADVLGCPIDRLDMEQTLARIDGLIESRGFAQHVAINAAKLVAMRSDDELSQIVRRCEVISADGQSVVWASRLLGDPLPSRVAGIDLMHELLARAEQRDYGVFVLGAKPDVLERACAKILERHPRLRLVGRRDGYFPETDDAAVAAEIKAARPDVLFVAISSPRKEYFLGRYGREIDVPFVMGVGGSVDVIAGITRRAPRAFQRLGIEWLYRLAQEPRRLWRRYLVTNAQFLSMLARELAGRVARA